jgi:hypothetical protein
LFVDFYLRSWPRYRRTKKGTEDKNNKKKQTKTNRGLGGRERHREVIQKKAPNQPHNPSTIRFFFPFSYAFSSFLLFPGEKVRGRQTQKMPSPPHTYTRTHLSLHQIWGVASIHEHEGEIHKEKKKYRSQHNITADQRPKRTNKKEAACFDAVAAQ